MPKEPTKPLSELLKDESVSKNIPKLPERIEKFEPLSLKHILMANAFQVMFSRLLNENGNASVMMRKHQLSLVEITNILQLTNLVGDAFDQLVDKPEE